MNHDEIVERLRAEALDEHHTGWVSDLPEVEYDENSMALVLTEAGWPVGSIDLGQLARIVLDLIEQNK